MQIDEALKILKVRSKVSDQKLHKAFRRAVLRFHPDRYRSDKGKKLATEQFIKSKDAYDLLMTLNPDARDYTKAQPATYQKKAPVYQTSRAAPYPYTADEWTNYLNAALSKPLFSWQTKYAFVCFFVGMLFIMYFALGRQMNIFDWPTVEGRIIETEIGKHTTLFLNIDKVLASVKYEYTVDGKTYKSELKPFGLYSKKVYAEYDLLIYKEKPLEIYYYSEDPERSFIDPPPLRASVWPLIFGLIIVGVGMVLLYREHKRSIIKMKEAFVSRMRKKKKK